MNFGKMFILVLYLSLFGAQIFGAAKVESKSVAIGSGATTKDFLAAVIYVHVRFLYDSIINLNERGFTADEIAYILYIKMKMKGISVAEQPGKIDEVLQNIRENTDGRVLFKKKKSELDLLLEISRCHTELRAALSKEKKVA